MNVKAWIIKQGRRVLYEFEKVRNTSELRAPKSSLQSSEHLRVVITQGKLLSKRSRTPYVSTKSFSPAVYVKIKARDCRKSFYVFTQERLLRRQTREL